MAVIWNPTGKLDVATDPADLPMQVENKTATSGAMTRCTNLHLDNMGIAQTRWGAEKVNLSVMAETDINRILEQAGVRYAFNGTSIYRNETSIAGSLTDADWSAILYNPYNSAEQEIYALNGTDRKVINGSTVREWGVVGPTAAIVVNPSWYTARSWESSYITNLAKFTQTVSNYEAVYDWEVDHINGDTIAADSDTYKYMNGFESGVTADLQAGVDYGFKYTYLRKNGSAIEFESNPSPAVTFANTLATVPIRLTWTASTDSQITHVRIYRTLADGTVYYYDTEYAAAITRGISSQNESSLGTECDWTNRNRPPLGTKVLGPNLGGNCFIIKGNWLYFCLPNQPEYWPEAYYIEVCPVQFPLQAGAFLDGQLFVASKDEIYSIQGSGATSFFPLPMAAICGTVAPEVFEAVKGFGIVHLGNDGLYQYTGGKDQKISYAFEPIFWGETKGSIPGMNRDYLQNCILKAYNSKLYFCYPAGTSQYPDNLLIWDLKNDRVQHYQYSFSIRTLAKDWQNKRLLAGDTDGYIWEIEKKSVTSDQGTAIAWDIQGAEYSHLRKYFPRYARYDVQLISGTAAGYVILDDVSKQTHTLNGSRITKKRLVSGCNGDRLSMRIAGSGQVKIYGVEIE